MKPDRITGMPSWSEHVRNGEAFSAENFLIAVPAMVQNIQLFNPVASGIRVRLRTCHMISGIAVFGLVNRHDVALGTLGPPAGFIIENLLGGGAPAVAEMRSSVTAVAPGTRFFTVGQIANEPATYPPDSREWGFDLLEGQGILISSGLTNIVNWQWAEVPL